MPAKIKTPRGDWKAAHNGTPIQDYYVRALVKDREGRIVNRKIAIAINIGIGGAEHDAREKDEDCQQEQRRELELE